MPRHNPLHKAVELSIEGSTFSLLFDFEAVAEAEDLTGMALLTGLQPRDIRSPRINMVRAMLFACIRPHRPDMDYETVRELVNRDNIPEIWGRVLEAWTSSLAEPVEGKSPMTDQS